MAQTYKFSISMPVTDTLARNRITNTVHLEHVSGGLLDTDLQGMCEDLVEMYQARYGITTREVQCKAYDTDAVPNYPRASAIVNSGVVWDTAMPREVALCLSFSGPNRGNKSERGRIYLMPQLTLAAGGVDHLRPSAQALDWALKFYNEPNGSFPDLGGVDWKFGVWSPTYKKFRQATQAWVNDDWDTQRRRGLRETMRVTSVRDG
jgi:hypothetical protein